MKHASRPVAPSQYHITKPFDELQVCLYRVRQQETSQLLHFHYSSQGTGLCHCVMGGSSRWLEGVLLAILALLGSAETHGSAVAWAKGDARDIGLAEGGQGHHVAYTQEDGQGILDKLAQSNAESVTVGLGKGSLRNGGSAVQNTIGSARAAKTSPAVRIPESSAEAVRQAAERSGRIVEDLCNAKADTPRSSAGKGGYRMQMVCGEGSEDAGNALANAVEENSSGAAALLLNGEPLGARKLQQEGDEEEDDEEVIHLRRVQVVLVQVLAVGGILLTMLVCGLGCLSVLDTPSQFEEAKQGQQQQQ